MSLIEAVFGFAFVGALGAVFVVGIASDGLCPIFLFPDFGRAELDGIGVFGEDEEFV